ncbi:hypothetical protein CDAR_520021 [Caerostris darwini]|uniref:Uncharacterized protein n=1 Tax=Caerostris darwini TaxID=1538125 RepID=A0AAV4WTW6_9ARAC|nr:hypothetical protein CDAR_520021 [Caerostris darwini]
MERPNHGVFGARSRFSSSNHGVHSLILDGKDHQGVRISASPAISRLPLAPQIPDLINLGPSSSPRLLNWHLAHTGQIPSFCVFLCRRVLFAKSSL